MSLRVTFTAYALLVLSAGCKEKPPAETTPSAEAEAQVAERASEALTPFKKNLKQALMDGLAKGPGEAIDVCRLEAPELAADASGEGLRVGRTSHRLRNPDNAPKEWMKPLLDAYLNAEEPMKGTHRVVALDEGGWGYAEPIYMANMCLTCHGESLPEAVEERLAAHYPDDEATGFAEGDFRGLFWVEVEAQ